MNQLFVNSLDQIVEFSLLGNQEKMDVTEGLWSYIVLQDKQGASDECRMIRKEATKAFLELYKSVFFASLSKKVTMPVLLFLHFGFVSEEVITEEQLLELCACAKELQTSEKIFTFYRWLTCIHKGQVPTSVNEFSLDYHSYLMDQVKNGYLEKDEAAWLEKDAVNRVEYEIDNMMISTMRMVSQSVLRFCPVLTEDDIVGHVKDTFLSMQAVQAALENVERKDCTIFYRNSMYSNPEIGIDKAFLFSKTTPNIILLPCGGIKGVMWQEIEGSNRKTPARFVFPIMLGTSPEQCMAQVCGIYRWEYCKRVEGSRWMDVAMHSLTSDYFDYISNYRQIKDLSPEAKEKMKQEIAKSNKNPRNVFVLDYMQYLLYEAEGAIKLNRTARELLFKHCPFSKAVLEGRLKNNVLYDPWINQRKIKVASEKKLCAVLFQKIKQKGKDVPEEILVHADYLEL